MEKQNRFKNFSGLALGITFFLIAVAFGAYLQFGHPRTRTSESAAIAAEPDLYKNGVEKVFEHRCVLCHSCNNAPCQLNLTSYENLLQGASKALVYDSLRTSSIAPKR